MQVHGQLDVLLEALGAHLGALQAPGWLKLALNWSRWGPSKGNLGANPRCIRILNDFRGPNWVARPGDKVQGGVGEGSSRPQAGSVILAGPLEPPFLKEKIIDKNSVKISIEASSIFGWEKYIGNEGISFGLNSFGKSLLCIIKK